MAKTEELRDGLFSITWIVRNFSSTTPSREVKVDSLQTFLKSCRLTCKFADSFLILKLVSAVPPDPSRKVVVKASYRSFKQTMELGDSKNKSIWGTGWSCVPYSDYVRGIKVEPPNVISFDILIDLKPDCVVSVMKGSKHVLDNLQKLWEHKTRSDVTFQCGDQVIKAHTLILASGSPVLAAMFENGFKESRDGVVLIVDIEAKVFENLLRYIYVGDCELLKSGEGMVDLFVAADKYDVESLKKECELHFLQTLAVENATQYLVLSHLHNSPALNESALDFIAKNAKSVCSREDWMEMIETYPKLCFQAVKRIAKCTES